MGGLATGAAPAAFPFVGEFIETKALVRREAPAHVQQHQGAGLSGDALAAAIEEYERIEEDHWSQCDMEVHQHPLVSASVGLIRSRIEHRDLRGMMPA